MTTQQLASNLWISDEQREFFVLVPPDNWMVKHNLGLIGAFTGGPFQAGQDTPDQLPFVHNDRAAATAMTPFHLSTIGWYTMDYNLEVFRHHDYPNFPSRFHALYLLNSREDAQRYRESHPDHVKGRILKRCVTEGAYKFSIHDSGWIEFLRSDASFDSDAIGEISEMYWSGDRVDQHRFRIRGRDVSFTYSPEVLFYGLVKFPVTSLEGDD